LLKLLKIAAAASAVRAAKDAADRIKRSLIWMAAGAVIALVALFTGAIAAAMGLQLVLPPGWPEAAAYGLTALGLLVLAVICVLVSGAVRKGPKGQAPGAELGAAALAVGQAVGESASELGDAAKSAASDPKTRVGLLAAAIIAGLVLARRL
jgi:hypothetical protein